MNTCSKEARKEVAKFERALRAYGIAACLKAFRYSQLGYGARSIAQGTEVGLICPTTQQADAAINAGRWAQSVGFTGKESQ
jgi:D-serine deaminase-like pyridoxal phosphate-dependent protein